MLSDIYRSSGALHAFDAAPDPNGESSGVLAVRRAAGLEATAHAPSPSRGNARASALYAGYARAAAARETAENVARETADRNAKQSRDQSRAARIEMILNSEEAVGREAAAERLAYETDLSVEDAIDALSNTARNPHAAAQTRGYYLDKAVKPEQLDRAASRTPTVYEQIAEDRRNFLAGR